MKQAVGVSPQVRSLQEICRDILKTSTVVDGKLYWCKRISRFLEFGRSTDQLHSLMIASLVKRGVLKKAIIGRHYAFASRLPKGFFCSHWPQGEPRLSTLSHVYITEMEDQLTLLANNLQEAAKFVGQPILSQEPVSFKQALRRVKEEIDSHPDSGKFFIGVVNKLSRS